MRTGLSGRFANFASCQKGSKRHACCDTVLCMNQLNLSARDYHGAQRVKPGRTIADLAVITRFGGCPVVFPDSPESIFYVGLFLAGTSLGDP